MTEKGYTVVDDTYNANPSSVKWALSTLSSLPCQGQRIAILGDMKELGDMTAYYHEEIGRFLKSSNIDMVMLIGEDVKGVVKELNNGRGKLFDDKSSLIEYAKQHITGGDTVLIKVHGLQKWKNCGGSYLSALLPSLPTSYYIFGL
jgi:UDP-N-acetylmuramoyl-tripeptide--D-alanyl-D-alanine ligase